MEDLYAMTRMRCPASMVLGEAHEFIHAPTRFVIHSIQVSLTSAQTVRHALLVLLGNTFL